MILWDALGRRWALRVLWELRGNTLSFRALRAACDDISPTVLNSRLRELRELGFVELTDEGYALTKDGSELGDQLLRLTRWAKRWHERREG
ncbi:MAG: helix-turn-helix domain-containing protein [Myxococcota bacterium]